MDEAAERLLYEAQNFDRGIDGANSCAGVGETEDANGPYASAVVPRSGSEASAA